MNIESKSGMLDIEIFKRKTSTGIDFYETTAYDEHKNKLGFINFQILDKSIWYGSSHKTAWIYLIETEEKYQHKGIGKTLLDVMEYVAVLNKCENIEGKYYPTNEYAKPFYLKNGYSIEVDDYEQFVIKHLNKEENFLIAHRMQTALKSKFEIQTASKKADLSLESTNA